MFDGVPVKLMRVLRVGCVGAALVAAIGACNNSPTTPTGAAFSSTDLVVGTGTEAVAGKTLYIYYSGWLYDATKVDGKGLEFDSNVGGDRLRFVLGAGQVIAGWDQGLAGMKIGGSRRLVIPPSLAYGSARNGPIPPNTTLVFDVNLVDVQ